LLLRELLFVAFGAIGFGGQAKSLFAVVADSAILSFAMVRFGNLCFFLHLEYFRVTIRALRLLCVHVCFVAEEDCSLLLGLVFYISSAHFLLSECRTQSYKACDANADDQNPPEFIAHFLTSFPSNFPLADVFPRK
jgi:hypothetical protein